MTRVQHKKKSNNKHNPNKNICALRVAQYLGVDNNGHYLHKIDDLVRLSRRDYTVRSRYSQVKGMTLGGSRQKLAEIAQVEVDKGHSVHGFIIRVKGHAVFVNAWGETTVDTAPRKRDARKMTHCYIVYQS